MIIPSNLYTLALGRGAVVSLDLPLRTSEKSHFNRAHAKGNIALQPHKTRQIGQTQQHNNNSQFTLRKEGKTLFRLF